MRFRVICRAKLQCGILIVIAVILVGIAIASAFAQKQPSPDKTDQESPATALPKGTKLILKDGNFQVVRQYQVQGDRVRYYSLERSAWEEIPAAMVDWDATHKEEAAEALRQKETFEKLQARILAERAASIDVDASIEIMPGHFLPSGAGTWVLDGETLLPLAQSQAQTKLDKSRMLEQVIVPVPIVPGRTMVYLAGPHAKLRVTSGQPEFYMRTADVREPNMQLVRLKGKGKARQVEFINKSIVETYETRDELSIQRWTVARGVYRFTLGQTLPPGEYALTEIVAGEGMNLYVWDFGVGAPK